MRSTPDSDDRRQRALLDNILDMAWLKDRGSRYLAVSASYLEVLGAGEDEVVGRTTAEVWPPEIAEVYLRTDRAVLKSGRRRRYEESRRAADGELRWFDTIKSPLRDGEGRIVGTVGVSRDITERKRAEAELVASRAELRKLGAFEQRAREEERARIARELHDELGQTLTAIKKRLPSEPETLSARTDRLIAIVDQSIVDLRRIATELRPLILDELGLPAAIEWLTQTVADRSGLAVSCAFDRSDLAYDQDVSTAAFRIVQEALTNVIRHGGATQARVEARNRGGALTIEVSDDGRGMGAGGSKRGRLGLAGMHERSRLLGGSVEFDSAPGRGTTVRVRLPFARDGRRRSGPS